MRRLGGVVLFVLLTGCGTAPVQTVAEVEVTTTLVTTSTTTTVAPTTTTVAPAPTTRAPATTAAPRTATAPAAPGGCNSNYAGACIPTGPDVDCGDLSAKRFQVVGQDVYRLDADKDGIACES